MYDCLYKSNNLTIYLVLLTFGAQWH